MNLEEVLSRQFPDNEAQYTFKDTILYALGIGLGAEPLDPGHLRFVYEKDLVAMPTMANVLGHPGFWLRDMRYAINWHQVLHAEHRLTMHRPLPPEGHVVSRHDIMGIRDRGAGSSAMLHQRKTMHDVSSGALVASTITSLMLRGDGGCGDHGDAPPDLATLPNTPADDVLEVDVAEILPLIYRLSGDLNPLHIEPAVATAAGFPRPILHGLATMGIAAYAIVRTSCGFDPARLGSMALRFSRPVLPGDRIQFEFWRSDPTQVRFRATVPERDTIVLDRGTAAIAIPN